MPLRTVPASFNGGIVESGTYEELMEKDGEYAEMVRRQQI